MTEITITVYGTPAPQGSKRAFVGKSGKAHVIESSHDRVKSWRQAVIDAALGEDRRTAGGPLAVDMTFYLARPKGHYGTGRNAGTLRASAPARPHGKPDLSKLLRSTEDALTDAGLWADDCQVVEYTALAKCWADDRPPGALVVVRTIDETTEAS